MPSIVDSAMSTVYIPSVRDLELDAADIGAYAFEGCKALKKVSFPESGNACHEGGERKAHIGDEAFANCTGLESVTFNGGTYYIGEKAFAGCTNLSSVYSEVTSFWCDSRVFLNCTSLADAQFTQVWTRSIEFGDEMFKGCANLTHFKVKGWVEYLWLGGRMFEGCDKLASLDLADSNLTCIDRMYNFHEGAAYGEELEAQVVSYIEQKGRYEPDWLYQN